MNYIVMECHPGYAVLLDEDGRFVKAANFGYEVGETVTEPELMRPAPVRVRRRSSPWAYAAGALAACLTLMLGLLLYQNYMTPVSSIVLRINPEIRMSLNEQGRVVALEALNEDGETLLRDYESRGKDSLTVTGELLDRAVALGFLSPGGKVSFSIDAPDEARFEAYGAALQQRVTDQLGGEMDITVEIFASHDAPPQEETLPVDPAPVPPQDDDGEDDEGEDEDEDEDEDEEDEDENEDDEEDR